MERDEEWGSWKHCTDPSPQEGLGFEEQILVLLALA